MDKTKIKYIIAVVICLVCTAVCIILLNFTHHKTDEESVEASKAFSQAVSETETAAEVLTEVTSVTERAPDDDTTTKSAAEAAIGEHTAEDNISYRLIEWDNNWDYGEFSQIHSDSVGYYISTSSRRKNFTVTINAGHGTNGGSSVKTQCHPDGSPKVTGGSTKKGEIYAAAVSSGTTLSDGTKEADANLSLALKLKDLLLKNGYDVVMIREKDDVQLDNVARTVFANNTSDCHISLHYDSTENDKGFFYIGVPSDATYRAMNPVASHLHEHEQLGESILYGMKINNVKIYGEGRMEVDLTQTSYSTIPSVDVEVGDRASDHSDSAQQTLAEGILDGIDYYTSNY